METILNPLVTQLIGNILRIVMVAWSGEQASHAIEGGQVDDIAKALAPGIIAAGWAVYNTIKGRKKLVTAMGLTTPVSENELQAIIKSSASTPPVTLQKTETATNCTDSSHTHPHPPAA